MMSHADILRQKATARSRGCSTMTPRRTVEGLSPSDDKPTLSPSDDAAVERVARAVAAWEYERGTRDWEDVDEHDREAARVAIGAYRRVIDDG